jgi:hypothetical protein
MSEVLVGSVKEQRDEILKKHGLDFKIVKGVLHMNLETADGNGIVEIPTEYYGLYNDKAKKVINTVKKGYQVSQNDEIIEMVLKGIRGFGDLKVSKAGSIHDGRKVFIQLEIDGYARVGQDKIKRYITVLDSNDGSSGLSVGIGDLTMSCANQFFKFYKAGEMKAKHAGKLEAKIEEFPALITLALSNSMQLIDAYNEFERTPCTQELLNTLVHDLLGYDRMFTPSDILEAKNNRAIANMNNLYNHIEKETNQKGFNLWGLHSGVTSWTTHQKQAPSRPNGRTESAMCGTNYKANQKSLDFALKQVGLKLVM